MAHRYRQDQHRVFAVTALPSGAKELAVTQEEKISFVAGCWRL